MSLSKLTVIFALLILNVNSYQRGNVEFQSCDTVQHGFQCSTSISHNWGQYSPYFSVPSNISVSVPGQCRVNFAQILSRHAARDPTASKTAEYSALISRIHQSVPSTSFKGDYAFLANYTYALGADQLTAFGQQEMINSGIKFFGQYQDLSLRYTPFIRSSSEERVVQSAQNFSQGFHTARSASKNASDPNYPYSILIISEATGSNNTLNHGLCAAFEEGPDSKISDSAQAEWAATFVPPIQARLRNNLPGANLTQKDTIDMMDLCPFNTVASPSGALSPFCNLFTQSEWEQYDYYRTLGEYYGFGEGNPLGPTQGVGWAGELLARLTGQQKFVRATLSTSVNHTLDDDPATFPLGLPLYADFSHDSDITSALAAIGLYNTSQTNGLLPNNTLKAATALGGYSASWTVPFAARLYVEKMTCQDEPEDLVRAIVNDRVVPLQNCGADALGRKLFEGEKLYVTMKPMIGDDRNTYLQTHEGHQGIVTAVVLTRDCKRLVSGSNDRTVRLQDAESGTLQ
ncbi:MAG: hypothetical protein M1821_005747 [Bathelium mastoideum]|nr:MAG: hypothetical protein M1821_005747 [Bathelium mastoideum]